MVVVVHARYDAGYLLSFVVSFFLSLIQLVEESRGIPGFLDQHRDGSITYLILLGHILLQVVLDEHLPDGVYLIFKTKDPGPSVFTSLSLWFFLLYIEFSEQPLIWPIACTATSEL